MEVKSEVAWLLVVVVVKDEEEERWKAAELRLMEKLN